MQVHILRAIVALVVGLAAVPLAAAADEDDAALSPCADFLQTADPDSPCTVGAHRILSQFAQTRSRDADGMTLQFPNAMIRYGASRALEIRLGLPSLTRRFADGVESRSTEVLIGLKTSTSQGRAVAGLALDATMPSGNSGGGGPAFRAVLSGAYALDKRVNFVAGMAAFRGAAEDDPGAIRRTVLAPTLGIEFEPIDGTELELGITGENTTGGFAHEVEASAQHRIGRSVALRLSASRRTAPAGRLSSTVGVGLNALL
jgi:hypothetical protein